MKGKMQTCVVAVAKVAGVLLLGSLSVGKSYATDYDYKPAYLLKGTCGHDSISISIDGKKEHVMCKNLDTYTGRGYYEREHCYKVKHGKKYDKHNSHYYHGHYHHGYYKHCVVKKHHYQLPVITIEKRAYDKHKNLLSTNHSPSFEFHISTNGGYSKGFHLKSRQKYRVIPPKDHYTIAENAPHYKTTIHCDGKTVHGYKVNVGIDKPGKQVSCVFNNYKPHHHKPKPHHHKPKPHYTKPKACVAVGHTLRDAKHAYAKHCHVPRRDCDPIKGRWYCSSEQIGKNAPPMARW